MSNRHYDAYMQDAIYEFIEDEYQRQRNKMIKTYLIAGDALAFGVVLRQIENKYRETMVREYMAQFSGEVSDGT